MSVGDEDWLPSQSGILKVWGEICAVYRYLHFVSFMKYKKMAMRFTLPVIIISTLTGTANFSQGNFPDNMRDIVPLFIGGLNLIAAIATTISQFLKVNELTAQHGAAASTYGKMSRHIRLELNLPPTERTMTGHEFINLMKLEMDRMIEQSPSIPKDILTMFEKKFPRSNPMYNFARPEILEIRSITPFSEEMNEKMGSSAKRIRKAADSFFSMRVPIGDINEDDGPPLTGPPTYEEIRVAEVLSSIRRGESDINISGRDIEQGLMEERSDDNNENRQ